MFSISGDADCRRARATTQLSTPTRIDIQLPSEPVWRTHIVSFGTGKPGQVSCADGAPSPAEQVTADEKPARGRADRRITDDTTRPRVLGLSTDTCVSTLSLIRIVTSPLAIKPASYSRELLTRDTPWAHLLCICPCVSSREKFENLRNSQ
jgi:hypothetical protein